MDRPGTPASRLCALHVLVLALTFALFLLLSIRQAGSLDAGFHLKSGNYILAGHAPPSMDQFTFTIRDHAVVNMTWGYDVLLALTERAAGAPGLVLLHALLVLAIFSVVFLTARLVPADPAVLAVLLLVGGLASEMRFDIRPELVSYLLLALVLYILHRHAEGRAAPLLALPVLHLLWSNLHSLFILGWGAIGCFVVGLALRDRRIDRRLLGWGAASVAAAVVNPYGLRGVLFPFTLATRLEHENVFAQSIGEFASPFALGLSAQFPFYPRVPILAFRILVAFFLIALIPLLRQKRFWSVLVGLAFFALSIRMVRNLPLFVVACLPGTVWGLPVSSAAKLIRSAWRGRGSQPRAAKKKSQEGQGASTPGRRASSGKLAAIAATPHEGARPPGSQDARETGARTARPPTAGTPGMSAAGFARRVAQSSARTVAADFARPPARMQALALVLTALFVVSLGCRVMTDAYYIGSRRMERFGLGWNHLTLPIDAVAYATRSGIAGPVLNHLNFGGFLMWARTDPVFIDGRLEVVGEAFFEEYQRALSSESALESCAQRYGITWMIFPYAGFPRLLGIVSHSPHWRLAYVDHLAAIFVRAAPDAGRFVAPSLAMALPPSRPPIAVRSLPGIDFRDAPQGGTSWLWRGLRAHLRRQSFPDVDFNLGIFRLYRGELPIAEEHFIKAIRQSGGAFYEIYSNLGAVLYREKRFAEAGDCYRAVLASSPGDALAAQRLREIEGLRAR